MQGINGQLWEVHRHEESKIAGTKGFMELVPKVELDSLTRKLLQTKELGMPKGGLEPPRIARHAPQTCASTGSAILARGFAFT